MLISSLRTTLRFEFSLFSANWLLSSTPTTPIDGSSPRSFLERLLYIVVTANWTNCSLGLLGTRLIVLNTSDWESHVLCSFSSHLMKPVEPPLLLLTRFTPSGIAPTGPPIRGYYTDLDTAPPPSRELPSSHHRHHAISHHLTNTATHRIVPRI